MLFHIAPTNPGPLWTLTKCTHYENLFSPIDGYLLLHISLLALIDWTWRFLLSLLPRGRWLKDLVHFQVRFVLLLRESNQRAQTRAIILNQIHVPMRRTSRWLICFSSAWGRDWASRMTPLATAITSFRLSVVLVFHSLGVSLKLNISLRIT